MDGIVRPVKRAIVSEEKMNMQSLVFGERSMSVSKLSKSQFTALMIKGAAAMMMQIRASIARSSIFRFCIAKMATSMPQIHAASAIL